MLPVGSEHCDFFVGTVISREICALLIEATFDRLKNLNSLAHSFYGYLAIEYSSIGEKSNSNER